ncbi:glutathione S-transferase [Acephala macrosclerotiorum]|nr:glutathione S-transferase [Acephala macrosclerotiorum]
MSTAIKPLTLWGGVLGPNPAKVSMILYSLDIPHEVIYVPYKEIKNPEYLKVNPNGRLPTIEDPNTGIRLWESGAIIDYLIEKYDKNFEISYEPGTEEYYLCKQWLHFQMSGQGPYYGQAVWFINLHPEKLQSCIDRYVNEIKRVSSVLNTHLSTNQWLVGNKCTYADLAFIPWQEFSTKVVAPYYDAKEEFPHVQRWLDEMVAMEPIKRVLEEKERKNLEVFGKKDEDKDAEKEEHK